MIGILSIFGSLLVVLAGAYWILRRWNGPVDTYGAPDDSDARDNTLLNW